MYYKITLIDGTIIELPMNSNSMIISHGDDYFRWWCIARDEKDWRLAHYYFVRETEDEKFYCDFVCRHNEMEYYKKASLYIEVVNFEIED